MQEETSGATIENYRVFVSVKTNENCHDTLCITLYMIIVE